MSMPDPSAADRAAPAAIRLTAVEATGRSQDMDYSSSSSGVNSAVTALPATVSVTVPPVTAIVWPSVTTAEVAGRRTPGTTPAATAAVPVPCAGVVPEAGKRVTESELATPAMVAGRATPDTALAATVATPAAEMVSPAEFLIVMASESLTTAFVASIVALGLSTPPVTVSVAGTPPTSTSVPDTTAAALAG